VPNWGTDEVENPQRRVVEPLSMIRGVLRERWSLYDSIYGGSNGGVGVGRRMMFCMSFVSIGRRCKNTKRQALMYYYFGHACMDICATHYRSGVTQSTLIK